MSAHCFGDGDTLDWGSVGLIVPGWSAPGQVRAFSTTRTDGFSSGAYSSFNLGDHCGDRSTDVARNRERLQTFLPAPPFWTRQVHGTEVYQHNIDDPSFVNQKSGKSGSGSEGIPVADAQVSFMAGQVCAILTADCLPVFFCDRIGSRVAVAHAGWRGLAAGILQATIRSMGVSPGNLLAWLGPAIGGSVYEVGSQVVDAFAVGTDDLSTAFTARQDRWLLDLPEAARIVLNNAGVEEIGGGTMCTYSSPKQFFSHRRDGTGGRMAHVIWLSSGPLPVTRV